MPRKNKKTEFSGSALLGSELRRLRGIRTLEDIQALCKSPPLAGKIQPISSSALCEIEQGRQMPRLTTLFALSLVYRVSMNQLMGFVMEEQMVNNARRDATPDDQVEATFGRLLAIGAWHQALPLALLRERDAGNDRERLAWRANRALCLANMGLHQEAVSLLIACLDSSDLSRQQEFALLRNLADVFASGGHFRMATTIIREAHEAIPEDVAPAEAAALEYVRAGLIISRQEIKKEKEERPLREAIRLLEHAERLFPQTDVPARLQVRCARAVAYQLLGNRLVAARDLEDVLSESANARFPRIEAMASLQLARVRVLSGQAGPAEALLTRAAGLAEAAQQNDILFEVSFELFKLLRADRPGSAVAWFRRCGELAPLLPGRRPAVQAFERVAAEMLS